MDPASASDPYVLERAEIRRTAVQQGDDGRNASENEGPGEFTARCLRKIVFLTNFLTSF